MAKKKNSGSDSTPEAPKAPATRRRTSAQRDAADERSANPVAEAPIDSPGVAASDSTNVPGNSAQNPTYEQIAEAAYQRYLNRGGMHGYDFDDWVEAERELRSRRS